MSDVKELEQETPLQALEINYLCGECGGKMIATKFQPYLDGVQHVCENGDTVAVLNRAYPYVSYRQGE